MNKDKSERFRFFPIILICVLLITYFVYLFFAFAQVPIDSDFASLVLEANEILSGNIFLNGWYLTGATFILSEMPFYLISSAIFNISVKSYILAASLMTWFMIISHITLSGQLSYTDAKFTDVPADFGAAAGYARGDAVPETPRWKFALSSELRYPVTEGWEAYARGSWQHVGKTPFGIDGVVSSGRFRPAYDIANFDIGAEGSKVDISLFVRNAFNRRGILAVTSGAVSTIPGVFENVTYVTPRTIGLTMRIKG